MTEVLSHRPAAAQLDATPSGSLSVHERLPVGPTVPAELIARLGMVDELLAMRAEVTRLRAESASGLADIERAGLQASIASLTDELQRTRDQLLRAQQMLADRDQSVSAQLERAMAGCDRQIREFKQATTWRVGRTVLAPLAPVKRAAGRALR
jgi:hypothetical protein